MRRQQVYPLYYQVIVSIHAPTRGATATSILFRSFNDCFNPRTHTGCDKYGVEKGQRRFLFQSTHPHGVRLKSKYKNKKEQKVSIHAPTRGATFSRSFTIRVSEVSIHAPTRGATRFEQTSNKSSSVSIHAPTRGATHNAAFLVQNVVFQSTHPHGVRQGGQNLGIGGKWFQSTHPHGVRLKGFVVTITRDSVSIHAPTRGATALSKDEERPVMFQSTHPHGVRPETLFGVADSKEVSIHAPTRGATRTKLRSRNNA